MNYRISRNGQIFGPYTEAEVRRYLASGNIAPSDLAQAEGNEAWIPVAALFPPPPPPSPVIPPTASATPSGTLYPDPPDFPWWAALLLGLLTGGIFFVVWDIVQAAWVRRVKPTSNALALYVVIAVLYLVRFPSNWHTISYNLFGGYRVGPHHGFLFFLIWLVLFVASRAVIRTDLMEHFNGPEPLGLHLNLFLTYLLGGLYIQYQFNRINERKRAIYAGIPAF